MAQRFETTEADVFPPRRPTLSWDEFNSGDPDAMGRAYPKLVGYASAFMKGRSGAEDLVQDALVKCVPALKRRQRSDFPNEDVFGYICTAIVKTRISQVIKQQRRDRRAATTDWSQELEQVLGGSQKSVEDEVMDRETASEVASALNNAMRPEYRDVVVLVDRDDQSYKQAAAELGLPIGTVMSRLFRGRPQAREALERFTA